MLFNIHLCRALRRSSQNVDVEGVEGGEIHTILLQVLVKNRIYTESFLQDHFGNTLHFKGCSGVSCAAHVGDRRCASEGARGQTEEAED